MSKKTQARKHLWFRAKRFGWGWYPVTWQGWAITVSYIVLYSISGIVFAALAPSVLRDGGSVLAGSVLYLSVMTLLTTPLLAICYRHGEEPRWRWGGE